MKPAIRWICVLVTVIAASAGVEADDGHVSARLVAGVEKIHPGETFYLGVLLEPEPGWHVYWRNPGEAGLATEVAFGLPEGFEVGELQWPTPVFFEQPGGLTGYGYEAPVVLAAEVAAPEHISAENPVFVTASWLACKDVCILGAAELKAELPLQGADLEFSRAAFKDWSETLPVKTESGLFELSATGGPIPDSGPAGLVVWLNWKSAPGAIEFFPDPGPGLKVEGVRVQTRGALTRIDLTVSRLKTTDAPAETLAALIVTRKADGSRQATVSHIAID
jgi:DsbC/DsbD-like thiol-disulfide interchange protein